MSRVLGIETSCDECGVAVYDSQRGLLSNAVYSQVGLHAKYGGIVPELASRKHLETLLPVLQAGLQKAGLKLGQMDAVAVTQGPGLIGSLLTGISLAKSLALVQNLPLIGVDHLLAHVYSGFLTESPPEYPFVALVVSGGHTSLYLVQSLAQQQLLGRTLDDAAGEAFDKVAKAMGLGYPGGTAIENLAKQGRAGEVTFPLPFPGKKNLNFSFSGIKTAVVQHLNRGSAGSGTTPRPGRGDTQKKQSGPSSRQTEPNLPRQEKADICRAFQEAVIKVLVKKTLAAAERARVKDVVLCGGVAANRKLRQELESACEKKKLKFCVPPQEFCTDNGAMIAKLGCMLLEKNKTSPLTLAAYARSPENRR